MRFRLLVPILAIVSLAGCMGIDVSSVRRAPQEAAHWESSVVSGKIKFVVDGTELAYGVLDRPAMLLFSLTEQRYLNTPIVERDGSFSWSLPPGEYGVAVLLGGMTPTRQPHFMANGHLAFVNGLVDPGVLFSAQPKATTYLGTLVIDVKARPAEAVFGGRVFGALNEITVVDESDPGSHSNIGLFRLVKR